MIVCRVVSGPYIRTSSAVSIAIWGVEMGVVGAEENRRENGDEVDMIVCADEIVVAETELPRDGDGSGEGVDRAWSVTRSPAWYEEVAKCASDMAS